MTKRKVAFIGAGNMAFEHIKAFSDIDNVTISGIYSRTRGKAERLAEEFSIPHICNSIKELYEETQSDLVVICVSELSVMEICFEAFKYPWICLIEKPIGYNYEQAKIISIEAEKRGTQVFAAFNRRHFSSTKLLVSELVKSNQKRLIQINDQESLADAEYLGSPSEIIENWMFANSIHLIDYFSILGRGEIISVSPIVQWNKNNPDFVAAIISYSSGDVGMYQAVWNSPGPWSVTVSTPDKRWELRPLEQLSFQEKGSRKLQQTNAHNWDTQFKPGLRLQAEEAVKALNGLPHSLPTIDDSLKSMHLVKKIYS
jgi:predicted dehydrogenase